MAISDQLTTLNGIKSDIKAAIIAKGGTATDDFTTYATAISNLPSGGDDLKDLIEGDISGSFEIPDGTTNIKYGTFYGCLNLTSVTIPSSVRTIDSYAFSGCEGLTSVTIPNLVVTIGEYTFYNCSGLTSVTIGNLMTSIANFAFRNCNSLTSITCLAATPPTIQSNTFMNVPATCAIYVPAASVADYQAANIWSTRASYIQAIPSADTFEITPSGVTINYDLGDGDGSTNECGAVEFLYNDTSVASSNVTLSFSPNYATLSQTCTDILDEFDEPTGEQECYDTFSTNQSAVGTYQCTATATYQGLTATCTVDIEITDSSQEEEPEEEPSE